VKVLSIQDAEGKLAKLCEEALAGEDIRVEMPNGKMIDLTPSLNLPKLRPLTDEELAASYDDKEWMQFENNCSKASD
jgi:hypothetical protein